MKLIVKDANLKDGAELEIEDLGFTTNELSLNFCTKNHQTAQYINHWFTWMYKVDVCFKSKEIAHGCFPILIQLDDVLYIELAVDYFSKELRKKLDKRLTTCLMKKKK